MKSKPKPYKYPIGTAVTVIRERDSWKGSCGRVSEISYCVTVNSAGVETADTDFLKYTLRVARDTDWTFFEEELTPIADRWGEYYDHRFKAKEGHVIKLEGGLYVVEGARYDTVMLPGGRMGDVDYQTEWSVQARLLDSNMQYNPKNPVIAFAQRGEIEIVGELSKKLSYTVDR